MKNYEPVIGLEIHAQLKTKSKIFCTCSTEFGLDPNNQSCPVCTGMPGVLPVLNKNVVSYALKAALATKCKINEYNRFARKNYFYPDLPKGYQISQFEEPLAEHGYIEITTEKGLKKVGITRIHMEEDAGKLIHSEDTKAQISFVDYNRTGVPLIEIVSEPDMRSSEEAIEYLKALKNILEYLEISDANMEEGNFRCDVNISIRKIGETKLGTKAELKNINSFKNIKNALDYEIERQIKTLNEGGKIAQETRLWNPDKAETFSMRSKEEAHDYRYFPDPDLIPVNIDEAWINDLKQSLPELGEDKKKRFVSSYGIPEYDAKILTSEKKLASYFEECVKLHNAPKAISNWIMGDILRELKENDIEIDKCPVTSKHLSSMIKMIDDKVISGKIAKDVFVKMYKSGKMPENIVKEEGLTQVSDEGAIEKIVAEVIDNNPTQLEQYISGKDQVFGFFMGQAMKLAKGKANPGMLKDLLKKKLEEKKQS